jgi:hypothetical protein
MASVIASGIQPALIKVPGLSVPISTRRSTVSVMQSLPWHGLLVPSHGSVSSGADSASDLSAAPDLEVLLPGFLSPNDSDMSYEELPDTIQSIVSQACDDDFIATDEGYERLLSPFLPISHSPSPSSSTYDYLDEAGYLADASSESDSDFYSEEGDFCDAFSYFSRECSESIESLLFASALSNRTTPYECPIIDLETTGTSKSAASSPGMGFGRTLLERLTSIGLVEGMATQSFRAVHPALRNLSPWPHVHRHRGSVDLEAAEPFQFIPGALATSEGYWQSSGLDNGVVSDIEEGDDLLIPGAFPTPTRETFDDIWRDSEPQLSILSPKPTKLNDTDLSLFLKTYN